MHPTLSCEHLSRVSKVHARGLIGRTRQRAGVSSWNRHSIIGLLSWCSRHMLVHHGCWLKPFLLYLRCGMLDPDGWWLERERFRLGERLVFLCILDCIQFVVLAAFGRVGGIIVDVGGEGWGQRRFAGLEARGIRCRLGA